MAPKSAGGSQRGRRPTRRSVAERAGVAETTVSFVLNGRGDEFRLSPATQQRVRDAARELNYVPSAAARALASRRTRVIGLAMSARAGLRAPVFADVTLAAIEQARELGHFVLQLPEQPADTEDLMSPMRDAGIAGLVCSSWRPTVHLGEQLVQAGFPVVWVQPNDRVEPRADGSSVGIDPGPGVTELADHLWAGGHRSVAVIVPGASAEAPQASSRIAPLLSRFGSGARIVPVEDWSVDAGRTAMAAVLADGDRPAAVFGANDQLACGAILACRAAGLTVPTDIAVAGYGDFGEAQVVDPALTTISWPLLDLGREAVRLLIRCIEDGEAPNDHLNLPTALVRRASA